RSTFRGWPSRKISAPGGMAEDSTVTTPERGPTSESTSTPTSTPTAAVAPATPSTTLSGKPARAGWPSGGPAGPGSTGRNSISGSGGDVSATVFSTGGRAIGTSSVLGATTRRVAPAAGVDGGVPA